jgi:predicted nucleotidyltransferase
VSLKRQVGIENSNQDARGATMNTLPPKINSILGEVREELKKIYSDRLKAVILFGSYARGDHADGSDIDLAILVEGMVDIMTERDRYLPILSRLSLKHDILISVVPFDYGEFNHLNTPLALNVRSEGLAYEQ